MIDASAHIWYSRNLPICLYHAPGEIDFVGMAFHVPVALCCFTVKFRNYFSYAELERNSAAELFRFQESGGHGFVAVYFRKERQVVRISMEELVTYRNGYGGQSIPVEHLIEHGKLLSSNLVNELDLFHTERITLKDHSLNKPMIHFSKAIWK